MDNGVSRISRGKEYLHGWPPLARLDSDLRPCHPTWQDDVGEQQVNSWLTLEQAERGRAIMGL
jgi:hypothetical protein